MSLVRRAAGYRRALGRATGVRLAGELEQAAERMSAGDTVRELVKLWGEIPLDLRMAIWRQVQLMWQVRPESFAMVMAAVNTVFGQNPAYWQQRLTRSPGAGVSQLAAIAARSAGLPRKRSGRGMSPTQVRQYHGRQLARGIVPGRDPRRRLREMELELEFAASELEAAASASSV